MASALWGFAFVAQRVGAEHVGPFSFTAVRFLMGGLLLVPIIMIRDRIRHTAVTRRRAANRKMLWPGIAVGILLTIAVNLQQVAMISTPAGNAAFITGLYMVFVPVLAAIRGHRTGWGTIFGVIAALAGLYLISVTDDLSIGWGEIVLIISTLFWAIQIVVIEHFAGQLAALRFATTQFLTCGVLSAALAVIVEPAPFANLGLAWAPLLYGGLISVGIAYTLQVLGQRHARATHAALIMSTEAVFGAIGGALLLGENMGPRGYLGAVLIIVGIVVAQLEASRQVREPLSDELLAST